MTAKLSPLERYWGWFCAVISAIVVASFVWYGIELIKAWGGF